MRMIFGAIGGMRIGRGNRSTQRKPTPAPLCPPQNPTWQTRSRSPDRSGGKPAINHLSYGAAFLVPFRRLLRLAGSRWRYSTPPPHGFVLNYVLRHEGVWGSGCIDPHFLDLGTSWRWVVTFTPQLLYPRRKSPGTHWIGGWVDPRAGLDDVDKR
jgi:hypothetical protein